MSFTRTLKRGNRGKDVEAAKRGVYRFLGTGELTSLSKQPEFVRQFYGPFFVQHVKKAQKKLGLPQTGVFGPATQKKIMPYLDDYAKSLLRPKAAPKPKLVAPNQGYGSLTSRLWEAYSLGRNMGMSDLGTYNPASRLPSGRRSDHAYLPAKASRSRIGKIMGAFDYGAYKKDMDGRDDPRLAAAIRAIKRELIYNGFGKNIEPDLAYFGDAVHNRVREFQASRLPVIPADGQCGQKTLTELFRKRVIAVENEYLIPRGALGKKLKLESGYDPVAIGYVDPDDTGIAQINIGIHASVSKSEAFDPAFAID
jgi:hypothetical protein